MRQKLPILKTDRQAASLVKRADLTKYNLSATRPIRFEFKAKEARVNVRLKK